MNSVNFFVVAILAVFFTVTTNADEKREQGNGVAFICNRNEVRSTCGRLCEDRCNALRPDFCKDLQCNNYQCRCRDGLVRNPYTDECVRPAACPRDGCGRGEIFAFCGRVCEATCRKPQIPQACEGMTCQKRECRCDRKGGFVRSMRTGNCIRLGKC